MQVHNNAPVVNGLLGGGTNYAFGYDDLYRLTSASGNWRGINTQAQEERHRYTVAMSYDNMHNVMSKTQKHEWTTGATNNNWTAMEPTSYRLNYKYEDTAHPHAPTTIVDEPNLVPSSTCCNPDDPGVKFQLYKYDAKGNPTSIAQETCTYTEAKTVYQWDEENRLRFVDTNPSTPEVDGAAIYTYDAGGERIIKDVLQSGILARTAANATLMIPPPQYFGTTHNTALYPNGLLTLNVSFDNNGTVLQPRYTKHYYAGSQRIVSKNGTSPDIGTFDCNWLIIPFAGSTPPINPVNVSNTILQTATQSNLTVMQQNNITPPPNYGQNAGYNGACVNNYAGDKEQEIYWFHPDHLGSSSYITGLDGEVTQNIEYFPSGEVFVENHNKASNNSPYKFNGKELDAETGYYYYGARYYNPRVSLWLNVDPLAEEFPGWSPYVYALQNPVKLIDPDGMAPIDPGPGPKWNHYSAIGLRGYSQVYFQSKTNPDPWTINTFFGGVNLQNPTAVNAHILHVGNEDFMFSSYKQLAVYANAIDWNHFDETHEVQFNSISTYQGNTYTIGKRPVTLTEVRDNVAAIQELSCNCGAVMMGAVGASQPRFKTIEDVMDNPNLLKNTSPSEFKRIVGKESTWTESSLGKGSNKGGGYKISEVGKNGKLTGRQVRYNPGSKFGRKGGDPYWRVVNYHTKSEPIKGK